MFVLWIIRRSSGSMLTVIFGLRVFVLFRCYGLIADLSACRGIMLCVAVLDVPFCLVFVIRFKVGLLLSPVRTVCAHHRYLLLPGCVCCVALLALVLVLYLVSILSRCDVLFVYCLFILALLLMFFVQELSLTFSH